MAPRGNSTPPKGELGPVHGDVVDTVIGPPDYIEQVINARRENTHDDAPPDLERKKRE